MDQTEKEKNEIEVGIQERIASLDAPVRDLITSKEYEIELKNIISAHSLSPENEIITEDLTASFLLGTIHPNDLEQIFIEELSNMTKDSTRSLYNDIKTRILSKVWNIVSEAWGEDDKREIMFKEIIELAEVPLPPNLQQTGISTIGDKIQKEINNQQIEKNSTPTNKERFNFEEKINNTNQEQNIAPRETVDRTLPKISLGQGDLYREKPE
jgi:hypothetical protein